MKYKNKKLGQGRRLVRLWASCFLLIMVASLVITLVKPGDAKAAIALIGSSTAVTTAGATSTTITLTKPAAVVAGSVMIAQLGFDATSNKGTTVTKPTGWVQTGVQLANGIYYQDIYYKIATAAEPATYTFTLSRSSYIVGAILAYSGVDTLAPVDDNITQIGATAGTTQTAPSASASTNGDVLVNFWTYTVATTATSYSAGLTGNYTLSTSNVGGASAQKALNNAGATGTTTSTTAASAKWLANTILLLPSSRPAGISYLASNTVNCLGCTNLSATSPTGWTAGDFFITSVLWNSAVVMTPPDATWIQIGSTLTSGSNSQADYYHISINTDANSYTWLFNGATNAIISTVNFAGVDIAAPIDGTTTTIDGASTNVHTAPSVTSLNSNDYYVGLWGYLSNAVSSTTAFTATLNGAWNTNDGTTLGSAGKYEALGNAGASGTRFTNTVNPSNNNQNRSDIALMRSIALKPFIPIPKLYAPINGVTGQILQPVFQTKDYVISSGPEKYKLDLCSNSTCTAIISTFDQTTSQTGWSGQDALTGTAYTGTGAYATSTMAFYTMQTPLTAGTTYYWRTYAYNINGGYFTPPSNINSFTTSFVPLAPTLFSPPNGGTNVPLNPEFRLAATDADADDLQYKIQLCSTVTCSTVLYTFDQTLSQTGWSGQDNLTATAYGSDPASAALSTLAFYNFTTANLAQNSTYYWRAYAIDPAGTNTFSPASSIFTFSTNLTETRIIEGRLLGSKIL